MSDKALTLAIARRGFSASGGAEVYLQRLAEGLRAAGHRPVLLTNERWPAERWPASDIIQLRGRSPRDFAGEVEAQRRTGQFDCLFSLERIHRCDLFRAGDGVHQAWLNRRAAEAPVWKRIVWNWESRHRVLLDLERELLQEQKAGRIIVNSRMVRDEIRAIYGFPEERLHLIYNGVPLEQFRVSPETRARQREELGLREDHFVVLFVGTGWERKGLGVACAAVELLHRAEAVLLVAGRGNPAPYRSARIRFLGEIEELPALYAAADVFVLPTIYDPFSNACLEAFAAGLPVITSNANGFGEIMTESEHGAIIDDPRDVAAFAGALAAWMDPARRQAAKPAIAARAREFDISRNVAATLPILNQAASAVFTSG